MAEKRPCPSCGAEIGTGAPMGLCEACLLKVAMGPTERTRGSEIEDASVAVPPLLVKDFAFSSLSDAV